MFIPEFMLWIISVIGWIGLMIVVGKLTDSGGSFDFVPILAIGAIFVGGVCLALGILVGRFV